MSKQPDDIKPFTNTEREWRVSEAMDMLHISGPAPQAATEYGNTLLRYEATLADRDKRIQELEAALADAPTCPCVRCFECCCRAEECVNHE